MSDSRSLRPLPPRPSLEYEKKEAKALLRRLRAGDPDALTRALARHSKLDASAPERVRLTDAQLVIAREYGFASWPGLVGYFDDVERERHAWRGTEPLRREDLDGRVRALIAEHRDRRVWPARALAAYVPRFYGMTLDEVFGSEIGEDDARLAVARQQGCPSWEVLLEAVEVEAKRRRPEVVDPMRFAAMAIDEGDLRELQRVIDAHPELLHPPDFEANRGRRLFATVVHHERRMGVQAMRPIRKWLESQGLDYQRELNVQLCGHMRMKTEKVRWLLDRGADASWVAPNGVPVLEHVLIRYWNGEAVDLLAARTKPREALWIAAGLGDVEGVRRSLDRNGKPTRAARRLRPEFGLVGPMTGPRLPNPDDEDLLLEAFVVAMLNSRIAVLEYMVSRGFPLNTLRWDMPMVNFAVGNTFVSVVECLVRLGADLDLRGWRPQQSAREIARWPLKGAPANADARRVAELVGLDPDAVIAEHEARPARPPQPHPTLEESLALAGNDAFRLGQSEIRAENLFYGALRSGGLQVFHLGEVSRDDLARFSAEVGERVRAIEEQVERPKLPMHADAQAALEWMLAYATEHRRTMLSVYNLLHALTREEHGAVAGLLARYGSSAAALHAEMERAL